MSARLKETTVKLLVTGGIGYIGAVVVAQLVAAGHDVTVIDDLSTGCADTVAPQVTFHRLGVDAVAEVLTRAAGLDGVLHDIVADAWNFFRTRRPGA